MEENKHKPGYYVSKQIWHTPTGQLVEQYETVTRTSIIEALRDWTEIVKSCQDIKRETNVFDNVRMTVILFWCDPSGDEYPLDSKDIT